MLAGQHASAADAQAAIVLPPEGIPLDVVEVELARQALSRAGGNLTRAAKLLDISRDQLRYKLKKAGGLTTEADEVSA